MTISTKQVFSCHIINIYSQLYSFSTLHWHLLRQIALSKLTSRDAVALALQKNQSLQAARAAIDKAGALSQYAGRLDNP